MKTSIAALSLLLASANAFAPTASKSAIPSITSTTTRLNMFSGGAGGAEDDPEQQQAMENAAKQMGMSVEEYKMGVNARMMFEKQIGDMRVTGGDDDIGVEADGRAPPGHLEIKLTEAGKAKGPEAVSDGLKKAFATVAEGGRSKRANAQQDMMKYIKENMKQ